MNICLFTEDEINKPLDLRDERAQHIIKILHKKEGDSFSAGIINNKAGIAIITKIESNTEYSKDGKKSFTSGKIYFNFEAQSDGKKLYPLKMIIGFPRPIQLKRLLRDMASLGVQEVHLCVTDLGEKSYLKSDLANSEAGYKMLLDGTIQAASTHVPKLFMHSSLEDCLKVIEGEKFICLDNVKPEGSLSSYLKNNNFSEEKCVVAAIGSERGWTDRERKILTDKNFITLSMGKRVLRTETAATVAASLILSAQNYLD